MKELFYENFKNQMSKSINEFESKNNLIIPQDYFEFIDEFNGGVLYSNEYKVNNEFISVTVFYGLQKKYPAFDLEKNYINDMYRLLDKNILIIGDCLGNSYIGLSIGNKYDYNIYYIDGEDYISNFDVTKIKYYKISENFNDFVKKLKKNIM